MKFIRTLSLLFLTGVCLLSVSCSKMLVTQGNIIGTWAESYEGHPYYAPDGFPDWTFNTTSFAKGTVGSDFKHFTRTK